MKESTIQRHIMDYLTSHGAYVFKAVGNPMQRAGTPDLLVCWEGRFVGLEIKQPGEKATPVQLHELGRIEGAGGVAAVVDSVEATIGVLAAA